MNEIGKRIESLRKAMIKNGVSACIIPGTDPHASEYIADYWKERNWISGFTGSAGTVVITLDEAGLWTDSRYFLQASDQLNNTGIILMKQGLPETPDFISWLNSKLKKGDKVGVNSKLFSVNQFASMNNDLEANGIELFSIDLIQSIWIDRPNLPVGKLFEFGIKYSGKSAFEKVAELRVILNKSKVDTFILSALDDIAWLFNIRGNDVDYNPVVISYAVVDTETATLFIDNAKLTPETRSYLNEQKIQIESYDFIFEYLKYNTIKKKVLIDGGKLNQNLFESLASDSSIINQMSPVFKLKSCKNEIELAGFKKAMTKDGVALTKFFMWLEKNVQGGNLSEISINEKLFAFRSEQDGFKGESFGTIAGFGSHGAIVHYSATPETNATLTTDNILLLDSGGQYLDGTTDITRTVTLGIPSYNQKRDFTLVLKGHIQLSIAHFPVGTRGSQLDILARKSLWEAGLNYGHGTGHGVGHFLNVHEGPQSIRMEENSIAIEPGMILSNEPGMYRTNEYGIRVENLVHVLPSHKTEFGQFLKFETLTLFPLDKQLIDFDLLSDVEIEWLNQYHKNVYTTLEPFLIEVEKEWLYDKCSSHIQIS